MAKFLSERDVRTINDLTKIVKNLQKQIPRYGRNRNTYPNNTYIAKVPSGGIPAITPGVGTGTGGFAEPGSALCDVYKISFADTTPDLRPTNKKKRVYNIGQSLLVEDTFILVSRAHGKFIAVDPGDKTVGFQTQNYIAADAVFAVTLGAWSPLYNDWIYGTSDDAYAIDHRQGAGVPSGVLTGLGIWRPSDTYGSIIEVIDLDCDGVGTGSI